MGVWLFGDVDITPKFIAFGRQTVTAATLGDGTSPHGSELPWEALTHKKPMKYLRQNFLVLSVSCLWSIAANAAHPLVTDDAQTQGSNGNQIELNIDWTKDAGTRARTSALTYTRGLNDTTDVFVNIPNTWRAPDSPSSGLNDLGLGVKWRFFDQNGVSLGLKPEWTLATGNEKKGLGNGKDSYALTVIAEIETKPLVWIINLNQQEIRYQQPADQEQMRRTIRQFSVGAIAPINEQLNLVLDLGQADAEDRAVTRKPRFGIIGMIYAVSDDLDLDIGYKKGLNGIETDQQWGVGVTWRFR